MRIATDQIVPGTDGQVLTITAGEAAWASPSGGGWQDDGSIVRLVTPADSVVIGGTALIGAEKLRVTAGEVVIDHTDTDAFCVARTGGTEKVLCVDTTNRRIGFDVSGSNFAPAFDLHYRREGGLGEFVFDLYSNVGADNFDIQGRRSRGTIASTLPLQDDDDMWEFSATGVAVAGGGFVGQRAAILFEAAGAWSVSAHGTRQVYKTTPRTGTTMAEVMVLGDDGCLIASGGTNGLETAVNGEKLRVVGGARFQNFKDVVEIATPGTPLADTIRLYAFDKNGFTLYRCLDSGGGVRTFLRDNFMIVRNTSGGVIAAGKAVYITGATGGTPNVSPARADNPATMPAIGITIESIANNAFGRVLISGLLESIDTSAFADGAVLYVSATTAGDLTATAPAHPNLRQQVAVVANSGVGNGVLEVETESLDGNFEGTRQNTFRIGDGTAGAKTLLFRAAGDGSLQWTPTVARTVTIPDADGTVILSSTIAATAFVQGGNSFGAEAVIGTNDAFDLAFERNNATLLRMIATGLNPAADLGMALGTASLRYTDIVANQHDVFATLGDANPTSRLQTGALLLGAGGASALDARMRRAAASLLVFDNNGTNRTLIVDAANRRIGTTTVDDVFVPSFDVHFEKQTTDFDLVCDDYGNNLNIIGRRSGGTKASPTAVGNGLDLFSWYGRGHTGSAFSGNQVAIELETAQAWTASNRGTRILFFNTPNNSSTLTERLRINQNGQTQSIVGVGTVNAFGDANFNAGFAAQSVILGPGGASAADTRWRRISSSLSSVDNNTADRTILFDVTNKRLGINGVANDTFSPSFMLHSATNDGSVPRYVSDVYDDTAGNGGGFVARRARGTFAAPTAVQSGDLLMSFSVRAYGATGFASADRAYVRALASEAWTDAAQGVALTFGTTTSGTLNTFERVRILNDGVVLINRTSSVGPIRPRFEVDVPSGGANTKVAGFWNSAGGAGTSLDILFGTYSTWTVAPPGTIRIIDETFGAIFTWRSKTTGAASNADVERFRIDAGGTVNIATGALQLAGTTRINNDGTWATNLIPGTGSLTVGNSSNRWGQVFADQVVYQRHTLYADQFENPVTADWAINALAPAIADSVNSGLNVRAFDDTVEEGVGFTFKIPVGATQIIISSLSRASGNPTGGATDVVRNIRTREIIGDSSVVGAWSAATALNILTFPTGVNGTRFLAQTQTIDLSTLSLTAGRTYQFEYTRDGANVADTLVGDWLLLELVVEFR